MKRLAKIEKAHEHRNPDQRPKGVNKYGTFDLLTAASLSSHYSHRSVMYYCIIRMECRSICHIPSILVVTL
jgi:hypothetical protein